MSHIDIAIPCYNYGRFLRDCVGSVLSQGVDDLRILIIDNASVDDSAAVARELAAGDPRIAVKARAVNLGPQASFNEAIDWAEGDYFTILCADDLLAPGALRRAITAMEGDRSISFAYGRDIEFRDNGELPVFHAPRDEGASKVVPGEAFIEERCTNPVASASVVTRTRSQKLIGHYRPSLPYTDDLEMLLRLAAIGNVAVIDAEQGARRMHGANMADIFGQSRAHDLTQREAAFQSFFHHEGARLREARRLEALSERYLAERAYWWAVRAIRHGRWRDAGDLLAFALKRSPSMALVPPLNFLLRHNGRQASPDADAPKVKI